MKDSNISFWVVPHEIATLDLGLTEKSILAVVFSFTRNGGECWATDKQFAVAFGMGERTIERAISRLYLLGYLERHVERKAGGVTPRRLSMTLPYRQIDATPHGELPPYRQIDATLAPNCPPPTVKMTLGYRQNDAQIVNNKKKEKEYIISTPLSQDDTPTPLKKNEVPKPDSVLKDSLTTEEPFLEKLGSQVGEAPPIPVPPPEARKPKKPDLTIDAVDALEVPDEVKAAAKRWFGHKQAIRSPIKIRKLLSEITKYGLGLPLVVQRSISSNWDGLWPIKYQDLDEVADEAVNKLFICMSEDGDWVEAGRSNSLLKDSLEEFMGANGVADKEEFKARSEGNGRTFILKDIKRIYIRKLKQTLYTN